MPTRKEIETQIADLQKQLDAAPADSGDEVELWVRDDKGRETKLTGPHAKRWLKNLGLEDDEPQGDGDQGGDGGGTPPDPDPSGGSVWGRKKA
jgi:hypothetical protein